MKQKSNPRIKVKVHGVGGQVSGQSAGGLSPGGLSHGRGGGVLRAGLWLLGPFLLCPTVISHVNMLLPLLQIGPDARGH